MDETIQHYDHILQKLTQTAKHKAKKLLEYNCLKRVSDLEWKCDPIPGYNTRTYTIKRLFVWDKYKCNCQGFNTYGKCVHTETVAALEEGEKNHGQKMFDFGGGGEEATRRDDYR